MTTCLILTTYNRPEYLTRCLASLLQLQQLPDLLMIIDDCSTNPDVTQLLNEFEAAYTGNIERYQTDQNRGIRNALKIGFDMGFAAGYDLCMNLDPDAVVSADFVTKVKALHERFPDHIVSGFNSRNRMGDGRLRNEVLKEGDGYAIRQSVNGINIAVNKSLYEHFVLRSLVREGNWDNQIRYNKFANTVPSCIQHIGMNSSMGHDNEIPDYSHDFKTLHLPDVTLFGIDAHDPEGLKRAAEISQIDINFGAVNIITERLFSGREAYSKWIIENLCDQFTTSHVLIIHPDGYVLNPQQWQDSWLQYDYIGAVWEWYDSHQVGNGGFSLRSKRLCLAVQELYRSGVITEAHPEDDVICRQHRKQLEDMGMRFAPVDVARQFSIEAWRNPRPVADTQFGFHGRNLDMNYIPRWQRFHYQGKAKYPALERYMEERQKRQHKRRF